MVRFSFAALLAALALAAHPAAAQTRLTLFAGPLVPLGEFGDGADLSWTVGARGEFQRTNALGQRRLLSIFVEGAYGAVSLDSEVEAFLEEQDLDTSTSLFTVAGGMRAYARTAPLFLSAGAGYLRYLPAGDADGMNGLDLQIGAGFSLPVESFQAEAAAVLHEVLLDTPEGSESAVDDLQFLTVTAGVSFPF